MKLKTLKDMKCIRDEEYSCCKGDKSKHKINHISGDLEWDKYNSYPWTNDYDLKQEAINDIKSIQSLEKTPQDKIWEGMTGEKIVYSEEAKQGIINYIKWKFNLSEEDLK